MPMRAATVVQQLCKSCGICFKFYCMIYFTCGRPIGLHTADGADATQLSPVGLSRVGVGGVYWALVKDGRQKKSGRLEYR